MTVCVQVLPRLPRLLAGLQADIDSNVDNLTLILTKLCCMLLLIWHWIACLYFRLFRDAAPAEQALWGADEAGWFREAEEPGWGPVALISAPYLAQYAYALHWAIAATSQTMHPTPDTPEQQAFAVVAAVVGVLVVAVSVGAATTIIAELHAQASDVTARLGRIRRYMREKGVGRGLRGRVLAYYAFRFGAQQQLDDEVLEGLATPTAADTPNTPPFTTSHNAHQVLEGLPASLKLQLTLVMHSPAFVKLPLFWLFSPAETLAVAQRLQPVLALPGEALVKAGEKGAGLFLMMKGAVQFVRDGSELHTLYAIAAFGEHAPGVHTVHTMHTMRMIGAGCHRMCTGPGNALGLSCPRHLKRT